MPRVLITAGVLFHSHGRWREILEAAGLEVVFPKSRIETIAPDDLLAQLDGVEAALAGMEPFNRDVLTRSKMRVIARMGVGYDAIDVPAATECGVLVTIAAGANEVSVAEHTLAMMLAVVRGFPARDQWVRQGRWNRVILGRLSGKTLGLVGLGRIGKAVVPRAIGLGLNVIASDPIVDPEFAARHGVRLCSLDELYAEADIISLHAPNTPETYNLINAASLAKMKRGVILVNTARGALVDEDALVAALASGHVGGAGLDVFKTEPLPMDSPLLRFDNVLVAPHMAGLDHESEEAMARVAAQCVADLYRGSWPEGCVVNRKMLDGWSW